MGWGDGGGVRESTTLVYLQSGHLRVGLRIALKLDLGTCLKIFSRNFPRLFKTFQITEFDAGKMNLKNHNYFCNFHWFFNIYF